MSRIPDIDLSRCRGCEGCLELCPDVFRLNPAGYVEVLDLEAYPEERVDEAIGKCPDRCIRWVDRRLKR